MKLNKFKNKIRNNPDYKIIKDDENHFLSLDEYGIIEIEKNENSNEYIFNIYNNYASYIFKADKIPNDMRDYLNV